MKRLTVYLTYLQELPEETVYVSATSIASALGFGEVLVRKDLAAVSAGGKPRVGYCKNRLKKDIENFLGYNRIDNAILVGAGRLGSALLGYGGFSEYGVNIVAAFDKNPELAGAAVGGKTVFGMERLPRLCRRMKIKIGIIAVTRESAQQVSNLLIENGILAIWNFAPTHLNLPDNILVHNENLAASLALLSKKLVEELKKEK